MAHENLTQQINTVIKVLVLRCNGAGVLVIVVVVGFADVVHAVQCVEHIQRCQVSALVVAKRHRCKICIV